MLGIEVIVLHVWSAVLLLLAGAGYVAHRLRSRAIRTLTSASALVYGIASAMAALLTVTGFAIYRLDAGLAAMLGGHDVARLLHAGVGYVAIPSLVLHVTLRWVFGRSSRMVEVPIERRQAR